MSGRLKSGWVQGLCVAFTLSLLFVLLEVLKAYRASQWSGTGLADAAGVAAGGALYLGAVLVLAAGIGLIARLVSLGRLRGEGAVGLACSGAAMLIWLGLSRYREYSPTLDDALVLGALLAFLVGLGLSLYWGWFSLMAYTALWALVLLGGLAALWGAGRVFLFDPDRTRWITVLPTLYMLGGGLPGLAVWLLTRRRGRGLRMGYAVLVLGLPIVLSGLLTWSEPRPTEEDRPNLVFIVADSLRAESLQAYGGPVATPHLDAIGEAGAFFEAPYSLAPWTMPSMAALFGSSYPPSLNPASSGEAWLAQIWRYAVTPESRPLAERLREKGYTTGAMTANALLWSLPNLLTGFTVEGRSHPILLMQEGPLNHLPFLSALIAAWAPAWDGVRAHDTTKDMTRYARAFLRRHRRDPFFLYIHYIDPHAPYDPPARFRTMDGPWPMFYPYAGGERWGIPRLSLDFDVAEESRAYTQSLYEGEVRYIDAQVGLLLEDLRRLGLADSTYLCFTSDHGEEFWEHGRWGHGQSVYDELVRVPLMLAGPDIPAARVATPLSALHLTPTLAGLLGCEADPHWRGRDFSALLRTGERAWPPLPIYAQGTSNKAYPHPGQMVIESGFKLIREAGSPRRELYDLTADPEERENLYTVQPEKAAGLDALLEQWLASFEAYFDDEAGAADAAAQEERFEQLRGMGYL